MKEGETTLIELDAYVDGYFCDMTRTMAAGKPSEKAVELWEIVCEQLKGMMSLVKAGTPVKEICGLAREIAANHGYSGKDNFVHNPGRGTGLQLHAFLLYMCSATKYWRKVWYWRWNLMCTFRM